MPPSLTITSANPAMSTDPFLRASLSTYLDADSIDFGASDEILGDLDLLNVEPATQASSPMSDASPENFLYAQPPSPPDSSQSWSGGSSAGSDDDGTHFNMMQQAQQPTKRTRIDDMSAPGQSMLRFPTWNDPNDNLPPLIQPKVEPDTDIHVEIEQNPAVVRAKFTPSPDLLAPPAPLTKQKQSKKLQGRSSSAKEFKSIPPLKSLTAGKSSGAGIRRKTDSAETARKRTLHNAIERRYRNSINDKIAELKKKLPPAFVDEEKMNKSTIIHKGIQYILALEEENSNLKRALADRGGPPSAPAVLLCVLVCGVFVLSRDGAPKGPSDIHRVHGSTRVLTGFGDDVDANVHASIIHAAADYAWYWVVRLALLAACLFLVFKQDVVTDPRDAAEQQSRCARAMQDQNILKAKHYATKALALLGLPLPAGHWGLFFGVVSETVRQLLHRLYIGQWIDMYCVKRQDTLLATWVSASVNHDLHQITLRLGEPTEWEYLSRMFLAMRAINAAESIPTKVDPGTMIQIYVSTAIQVELLFQTDLASVMSDYYLRQARRLYHKHPEAAPSLHWLFKPTGNTFFRSGTWTSNTVTGTDGNQLHPGCFEQLTTTFHLNLLGQGLLEIAAGHNTDRVHDLFADLRESAAVCRDPGMTWWGIMGLVHVSWRRGCKQIARTYLCELEGLEFEKLSPSQSFVYAVARAHQALLDGDHKLCWQACQLATKLCERAQLLTPGSPSKQSVQRRDTEEPGLQQLAVLLGYRQLLSTRVALVRLRLYLGSDATSGVLAISESNGPSSTPITRAAMLTGIQTDINGLRRLSEGLSMAQSTVFQYQAVHRSLAGGRVALTERMFHKGLKVAKEQNLPYEEASLLLHCAVCLRTSLSTDTVRSYLSRAASLFETLQAAEELCTSRKLLQTATY